MDRRTFLCGLTLGTLSAPLAAEAQQAMKVYKIGYLSSDLSSANPRGNDRFRQGLQDLGYVEGRDFVMEYRWAEGHQERCGCAGRHHFVDA
jgi:putative ABC transport system substrate-binding protein